MRHGEIEILSSKEGYDGCRMIAEDPDQRVKIWLDKSESIAVVKAILKEAKISVEEIK